MKEERSQATVLRNRISRSDRSRARRVRQLQRRIAAAVFTLCISALAGVLGFGFFSRAQSKDQEVYYKYFTSIQVQYGDTLYSIAREYADHHYDSVYDYMEEVCMTNHMLSEDIREGDYLVIPYYSTEFR